MHDVLTNLNDTFAKKFSTKLIGPDANGWTQNCATYLGLSSERVISLTNWCANDMNSIQHETLHALNLHHEQVRPDAQA